MKNRGGDTCQGCPFGLGIPFGCKMIGESAYEMKDLSESDCKEDDLNLNFEKIFLIKEHKTLCLCRKYIPKSCILFL